jgi:hypothetical protein
MIIILSGRRDSLLVCQQSGYKGLKRDYTLKKILKELSERFRGSLYPEVGSSSAR